MPRRFTQAALICKRSVDFDKSNVHFGSLADARARLRDVRYTLKSGHVQRRHRCPLSANSGHLPLRLLAVTGRRNFAACSLVEG